MGRRATIIMYHFVRDLQHSRFPEIKGLSIDDFKEQILYIKRHYTPIRMADLIEAVYVQEKELPDNAVLLTFDDGYIDHFSNVFPILAENQIQGTFFPPARAITKNEVLDVNKIHFVLATVEDKEQLLKAVFSMLDAARLEYPLNDNQWYYSKLARPSRFDTADVVFIKRLLQKELPEELRGKIVDELFLEYVTSDEISFSRELYMSIDQIRCMQRNDMYIGSHGYNHYWLDSLSEKGQETEIDLSLDFLREIGCDLSDWVMCYPYGAYNSSLLSILQRRGCKLGFGVQVDIANLEHHNPLILPRLDTNDLPQKRDASPNEWTSKVVP